ncbi:MAG: class I SAM-dependent methyltransferase [Ktedonobacteraceae bacterium]|jgi:SAM-dependent methyltransferase
MHNFTNASALTIDAYQHIAELYAATHTRANVPDFWLERLLRLTSVLRSNPAYQDDPTLPILDIGCGHGRDSLLLAQMDFHVIAADASKAMLEQASKLCAGQPGAERITFRCMDMRSIDLPTASCGGILASASFLHIPKRENLNVLSAFLRVLVPGGALMLLVKECDEGEAERYETHPQTGHTRFFARYRGPELWDLLEQAGFVVIEINAAVDSRFTNRQRWLAALATKG